MSLEDQIDALTKALTAHTEAVLKSVDVSKQLMLNASHRSPDQTEQVSQTETPNKKASAKKATKKNEQKTEKKTEKKTDDQEGAKDTSVEETKVVTVAEVKDLARDKIKSGVSRTDIKQLVTECGADMIGDLDDAGRAKLKEKLEELNNE